MTDREKLEKVRTEIERRKKLHEKSLINPIYEGFGLQNVIKAKIRELTYLLSFIDSMQEEQVKELLISKHEDETCKGNGNSLTQEPEDFKVFKVEYFEREKDNIVCVYDRHAGLVDGAQWQKEHLMAKAIRGHVGQTINGMLRALSDETFGDMGFTAGDKVKLIIIKED